MILHLLGLLLVLAGNAAEPQRPAEPKRPRVATAAGVPAPSNLPNSLSQGMVEIIMPTAVDAPPLSQRVIPPLGNLIPSWRAARQLRMDGMLDAARDTLLRLNQAAPHHALVLGELARVYGAQGDWAAVERLARNERTSQRDTLLLSHDLALALERLRKPREAAAVVVDCWRLRPVDAGWAAETLNRLVMNDSRGVRDLVRRAAADTPSRVDLHSVAVSLDWKMGDATLVMKELAASDNPGLTPPLRWRFADALLATGAERDSLGAVDALAAMASDPRYDASLRMQAARRAMDVHRARGTLKEGTPQIYASLKDVRPEHWNAELLVEVARGLREAGQATTARALLDAPTPASPAGAGVALERALDELHEGPPTRALTRLHDIAEGSPEARFRFAEALFFAGLADSALAEYKRASADPGAPFAGAAFERMYLIEDTSPKSLLPVIGRLMYLDWRGDTKVALVLADSLSGALQHGPLWARIAIYRGQRLEALGQPDSALVPILALANQLPDDRLAPVAREMAGDIYLFKLKRQPEAIAQYEECLTRYPRAWNSAEVRRRLEALKKGRL